MENYYGMKQYISQLMRFEAFGDNDAMIAATMVQEARHAWIEYWGKNGMLDLPADAIFQPDLLTAWIEYDALSYEVEFLKRNGVSVPENITKRLNEFRNAGEESGVQIEIIQPPPGFEGSCVPICLTPQN